MRILFVGAPGSGKSTLAAAVFAALKQAGRSAEHCHEWIRHDIQKYGSMTSIWEQYRTRQYQKDLEDAVPSDVRYVICDSGTLSPYFYAHLYSDPTDPRQRLVLQDMYKYFLDDLYLKRYDLIFYLPEPMASELSDGTRYQTDDEMATLRQHMSLIYNKIHRLPYIHVVTALPGSRVEEVMWKILGTGEPEQTAEQRRYDVVGLINFLKSTSQAC